MVAPGKNLEFEVLGPFELKSSRILGLELAVTEKISSWPREAIVLVGPIHWIDVDHDACHYRAYFGRSRNHVGLIQVFRRDEDAALWKAFELETIRRYAGGKK